jgi:hypothetical protein
MLREQFLDLLCEVHNAGASVIVYIGIDEMFGFSLPRPCAAPSSQKEFRGSPCLLRKHSPLVLHAKAATDMYSVLLLQNILSDD